MPLPDIAEHLNTGDFWYVGQDSTFELHPATSVSSYNDHIYPEHVLAQYHPHMPNVIRMLSAHAREAGDDVHVYGCDVKASLSYLNGDVVKFIDTLGMHKNMYIIDDLRIEVKEVRKVFIRGYNLVVKKGAIGNTELPIVTDMNDSFMHVMPEELEKRYPGWEQRWQLCIDLGLSKDSFIPYVFNNVPSQEISLQDITFD